MNNQKKSQDSRHASIHQIVAQNKNKLRKLEINQLFQTPNLSQFDTSQFQHHPYMISNQFFTFFVHELQKWNKKIRNKQITPFFQAELHKNTFIHSSLKIISLKKANQIHKYLEQLTKWYSKNSYNIPQPSVLMKRYNPNQQWQIRKTFRSNTPSEINNYRRRFLYGPDTQKDPVFAQNFFNVQKKKPNCFFDKKVKNYKAYRTCEDYSQSQLQGDQPFKEIIQNKDSTLMKLRNNQIKNQRQEKEIKQTYDYWKKAHQRFGQKTCRNFYQGKFNRNKLYVNNSESRIQPRSIKTAAYVNRFSEQNDNIITQIKKGRIKTSQGIRKNFMYQQKQNELIERQKTAFKNQRTQNIEYTRWIDNFIVDQDRIDFKNTLSKDINGAVRLMSNPFDHAKLKSKVKKRK